MNKHSMTFIGLIRIKSFTKLLIVKSNVEQRPFIMGVFLVRVSVKYTNMLVLFSHLQLVDITSRYIHPNKRGKVQHNLPPILERLNIEHEHWITLPTQFETCFKHAAGKVIHLELYAQNQHQQRVQCRHSAMRLLG